MHRLRWLGINTLGSRNTALRELVAQVPAPLVADMLGYSDQVTQKHAAEAGNTWAAYASTAAERSRVIPPQQRQRVPDGPRRSTGDQLTFDITDEDIDDRDTPASTAQAHVDALDNAANAVAQARTAVAETEEELAQAVLRAHQSGLYWAKIAAIVGISRQAAYQRWTALVRNPAEHDGTGNAHDPQDS